MTDWPYTIVGGPWPERIGLKARIVPAPYDARYPWKGKLSTERVVYILDDPHREHWSNGIPYSCVIDIAHLEATP